MRDVETPQLGSRVQLRVRLTDALRQRIRGGEWSVGGQLPTEGEISTAYGVSRSTVRAALQSLENQGLTVTRHGVGTFVTPYGRAIRSGLQELTSMSETVLAHGMSPGMRFRSAQFRDAANDEARALGLQPGAQVLATERAVLADGESVAFSFDVIPAALLPNDIQSDKIGGSLFALLEEHGLVARTAVAEIHAVNGEAISWDEATADMQFLLLTQTHYDGAATALLFSRTYFLEGRFEFSVLRTR